MTDESISAALAPVPAVHRAYRYRVTAPTAVLEHAPGSTFTALIPAGQEALLLRAGALERLPDPVPDPNPEPEPDETPSPRARLTNPLPHTKE